MTELIVTAEQRIEAPAPLVRRQFGDVAHHESTGLHRDATFRVISDDGIRCRYQQTTRVGPLHLRQEFELERRSEGPLVNRILKGQFTGGAISFDVVAESESNALVTATLTAPLRGPQRLASPLLRRRIRRSLRAALVEDKHDLERGSYPA